MELKKELEKLKKYIDTDSPEFDKQLERIKANFTSEQDIETIHQFIKDGLTEITQQTEELINEVTLRKQLQEVAEIVSLSYIAEKYFNKTRQWLYQRINGSMVNNKPARFSEKELETLNFALRDISQKIGSVNVSF